MADMLGDGNTDYRRGQLVNHMIYGNGIVIDVDGSGVRISFKNDGVGTKLISKKYKGLTIIKQEVIIWITK